MKMTKREYFAEIRELVAHDPDLVAFIDHEVELLDRKRSADGKPTVKEIENESLKAAILDYMVSGTRYTVSDIQKALGIETNQKASALIRQLRLVGAVERVEEKRKAYFIKKD